MFADTAAIATLGTDLNHSAADLEAIAAALPTAVQSCHFVFGPVGADFLAALATALAGMSRSVSRLGSDLIGAADTAASTAVAYVDAERRSITTLGG